MMAYGLKVTVLFNCCMKLSILNIKGAFTRPAVYIIEQLEIRQAELAPSPLNDYWKEGDS